MSASQYTRANIMAAIFDGVPYPLPAHTYLALHTADSSETGADEVTVGAWPAYARVQAEGGAAMGTGWTTTGNGARANAKQIRFSAYDGVPDITLTHWSIWSAATAGNMLVAGAITVPRTLKTDDVFEFDLATLTAQMS